MKDEDWEAVIDVNLTGTFRLIRAAMKGMMKRRSGAHYQYGLYCWGDGNAGRQISVKGRDDCHVKALAGELAPRGVTVNCVAWALLKRR